MSGWQPQGYDQRQQRPATPPQWGQAGQPDPWADSAGGAYGGAPQHYPAVPQRPAYQPAQRPALVAPARKTALTTAEGFWYILECVAFGAGYLCKVPAKKALQDFGMVQMTAAEQFWYVLMCICFGGGYFAKLPISKALSEIQRR